MQSIIFPQSSSNLDGVLAAVLNELNEEKYDKEESQEGFEVEEEEQKIQISQLFSQGTPLQEKERQVEEVIHILKPQRPTYIDELKEQQQAIMSENDEDVEFFNTPRDIDSYNLNRKRSDSLRANCGPGTFSVSSNP